MIQYCALSYPVVYKVVEMSPTFSNCNTSVMQQKMATDHCLRPTEEVIF